MSAIYGFLIRTATYFAVRLKQLAGNVKGGIVEKLDITESLYSLICNDIWFHHHSNFFSLGSFLNPKTGADFT